MNYYVYRLHCRTYKRNAIRLLDWDRPGSTLRANTPRTRSPELFFAYPHCPPGIFVAVTQTPSYFQSTFPSIITCSQTTVSLAADEFRYYDQSLHSRNITSTINVRHCFYHFDVKEIIGATIEIR